MNSHKSENKNFAYSDVSAIGLKFVCANEQRKTFWKIQVDVCTWLNIEPPHVSKCSATSDIKSRGSEYQRIMANCTHTSIFLYIK